MNNSAGIVDTNIIIRNLNVKTGGICGSVITFDSACLLILSISWSIYLIIQMMNDRRRYRMDLNTQRCRTYWCRENYINNYKSNKIKNTLLIVICLSECVFCISMYFYDLGNLNHTPRRHAHRLDLFDHEFSTSRRYTESLRNPIIRISNTLTAISVCTIFLSVNLLTQYLVHTYSYYQRVFKLKQKIFVSISFLSILFILGLIKPTILFQYILTFLWIISQFIMLCTATNKLQKLLKQRLKDSITHENQSISVIRYYQLAYREYRFGSVILSISLFLQMVGFSLSFLQPVVIEIAEIIHLKEMFPSCVAAYELILSSLEVVFLSIGLSMLIIPYFIVSIRLLIRRIRKTYKKNISNLGKSLRIQQLLQNNYNAYNRCHY